VSDPGYGPYVDIIFPFNGADGNYGSSTPDGINFVSASYLGTTVDSSVFTFPAAATGTTSCISHPYAITTTSSPAIVCGNIGDKLVVLKLPFGRTSMINPPQVSISLPLSAI
jgi:hypothetical protein